MKWAEWSENVENIAGYDSYRLRNTLKDNYYIPIIAHNKRNTKDKNKIKKLNGLKKIKYKKRIIVGNYFGWIKMYPKMTSMYEKTFTPQALMAAALARPRKFLKFNIFYYINYTI